MKKAVIEDAAARQIIAAAERSSDNIAALGNAIIRHQELYDAGDPVISDADFDAMVAVLRRLAPKSPVLAHLGKPVAKSKQMHAFSMLSLAKAYEKAEIIDWCEESGADSFMIAPKYDGVSLSLIYVDGRLHDAVTRGDGKEGDSVIHNVRLINSVPKSLKDTTTCVIRGELAFSKTAWEHGKSYFVARASKRGGTVNARNAAAGILQAKTPNRDVLGDLTFIAYDRLETDPMLIDNLFDAIRFLTTRGFYTGVVWTTKISKVQHYLELAEEYALECDFETDGVVVKVNDFEDRARLGATSHHPKWAIALKFQGQSGNTLLKDVVWQVSRTGTITPVAIVEPVELSGATIERCTLHNLKQLEALKLRIGCTVEMTRRGGVIPHIERVVAAGNARLIKTPERCPCCNAAAVRRRDFLYCAAPDTCWDVQRERLLFWATQTDMMGWGPEVIAKLYNDGDVVQPSEFYRVDPQMMIEMFGAVLGQKLIKEAQKKKTMSPAVFLRALGIDGIGSSQSEKIMEHFEQDINELLQWVCKPDLTIFDVDGVGTTLSENLRKGVLDMMPQISALLCEVKLVVPAKSSVTKGPFAGKKIVFTGKLTDIEREEARALVRTHGAETPAGVTKATDMLVVGDLAKDEQRTKREKAEAYNAKGSKIRVVTESEFMEMLAEATELAK